MKNIILVVAILACAGQQPRVARIPRYRGLLPPDDARYVTGMDYDPSDVPLAWLATDSILIGHAEGFSAADVRSHTCAGSGFYWVSLATGVSHPVAVGNPACEAALAMDGQAADPQGRWIVYSADMPPNNSGLFRLDLATNAINPIGTGCRVYHDQPAVSPDGRWLAARGLCKDRNEEHYRIYISAADGSGLREVATNESVSDEMPAWSPDGRQLVFQRGGSVTHESEIAIQDRDGHNRRTLAKGYSPAWSPDGQWIAFLSESRQTLRIIRPDGTGDTLVFLSHEPNTLSRGWGPMPEGLPSDPLVWSPDSRWIAFTRQFDAGRSVWRVEIASGRLLQVTAPDR